MYVTRFETFVLDRAQDDVNRNRSLP